MRLRLGLLLVSAASGHASNPASTIQTITGSIAVAPEPSRLVLLGMGLFAVAGLVRGRFKKF